MGFFSWWKKPPKNDITFKEEVEKVLAKSDPTQEVLNFPHLKQPIELDPFKEEASFFDKEKQLQAMAWLADKWPLEKRVCSICEANDWKLMTEISTAHRLIKKSCSGGIVAGLLYPNFMMRCKNCGLTHHFNASTAGLYNDDE